VYRRSANFPLRKAFPILFFGLLFALVAGCGAPGDPQPPSPPIPAPISDLTARQQGNGVQLVFTLPGRTVSGDRLAEPPAMEIFRGSVKLNGSPDHKTFKLVYTIPGALADAYASQGKIQFTDPVAPDDVRANPGATYAYRVRTRASKKKDSADSNLVTVKLYPVAEKIPSLAARVTQNAIELTWPAPPNAAGQISAQSVNGYHVYRGELDLSAPAPAFSDLSQAKWKSPAILLAPSPSNSYQDSLFDFGKSYVYFVRSVTIADGTPIESDDSAPAMVVPRDTFPPAVPQNVVVAGIPGDNGAVAADLSWSIGLESDLAGYRIYRSEMRGDRGQLLTPAAVLSPAYRDVSTQSGHRYFYVITAVDRAGNESADSEAALLDLSKAPQ
jgi:hypothetical protein